MTTFTTEDREYSAQNWPTWPEPWFNKSLFKDYRQTEIEFFWTLTEQIPLDLDYTDCAKPQLTYTLGESVGNGVLAYNGATWATTTISNVPAQLTVSPNKPIGELIIGPINIGLEKDPTWYQKILYKLLGFNWRKN